MSAQSITPELRHWIVEQAKAGHKPEVVLKSMMDSGWEEEVAIRALEETLQGFLDEHAKAAGLPAPKPVPEPSIAESPSVVRAFDRDVRIVMSMRNPRVVVFGGLLSDAECDELIELSRPRLARSETVEVSTGGSEVNAARTSAGMFFERGENPLCARIEQRIATLVNWPVENGEGLQILHYRTGGQYAPHFDYFPPDDAGSAAHLAQGGQRVASLVIYLNDVEDGGATVFPEIGLTVGPKKGAGVYFEYCNSRGQVDPSTLHGGLPVLRGEKWIATKWLRQRRYG